MADQTHYSTSEITPLLHNETNPRPSEFLDSLTIPNSTSFLGERNEEDELFEGFWRQSAKKRRLSVNQVQFLEKNFEVENKLEPDRKIQLAKELGLQPRQVAIWFQNRRARCKTKQLEKDYASLKTSYQNLKSNFESLFHEREKLKTEVQILKEKLGIPEEGSLTKSAVLDSSSENHNSSMADSSHEFEPELSDCFSHDEEENLSRNLLPICFPKWETCYYEDQPTEACCNLNGFQFEDQALGFWTY